MIYNMYIIFRGNIVANDAFTIKYQAQALNSLLSGGKINKIMQPNSHEVILNVYANGKTKKVVISTNASLCRIAFTDISKENPLDAPSFCMLLRKHLTGGTITNILSIKDERIIKIDIENKNDFSEQVNKTLYVELMGKYSNVILTFQNKILGALHQASLEEASKRPILSGLAYTQPIAQDKLSITDLTQLTNLPKDLDNLTNYLLERVKGISYNTAQELAYRHVNNFYNTDDISTTAKCFDNENCNPCVLTLNNKIIEVLPFKYHSLIGEYQYFDNIIEASQYFYDNKDRHRIIEEKRNALLSCVKSVEKRLKKKLQIIVDKQNDCADLENDKIKGELLLTYSYMLKDGIDSCILDNYYDATTIKINLNENLTIKQNAQNFYNRYNKKKRTLQAVEPQKVETDSEIDYISSIYTEINCADCEDDLRIIAEELVSIGFLKKHSNKYQTKNKKSEITKLDIDGFNFIIGKNNIQNDEIVKNAKPNDIWLHTKNYHSAHGLFIYQGTDIPIEVLTKGAKLVAERSSGKNASKVEVDYTKSKYVKKPKGSKPGFVTYTNFKTIIINQ